MMTDGINGITKLLGTEDVTSSEHLMSTIIVAGVVAYASSKYTRSRVSKGQKSVLGFF